MSSKRLIFLKRAGNQRPYCPRWVFLILASTALSVGIAQLCLQMHQPAAFAKSVGHKRKTNTQPTQSINSESNFVTRAPREGELDTGSDDAAKLRFSKKKNIVRGNAPCLRWVDPDVSAKAVILCVHGLGLHNGTYDDFGKRMAKLGFPAYAIDVRGFGSWMEASGREEIDFDGCLNDVMTTLKVIRKAHPSLPVFILGESMGGAIALRATAAYPDLVDGLISSVPAADRFKEGKTKLKVALQVLGGGKDRPMDVGSSVLQQATEKPELRQQWSKDPLAKLNLTPRELIQFQRFMNENHDMARQIKNKPVLFVQGCEDKLVKPEGTVELYNEVASPDREIVLIPQAEHLIFEENQFTDKDIDIVSNWIERHLAASSSTDSGGGKTQ
jgi:alpha-beta hydrolase superfamily lysophospholipase